MIPEVLKHKFFFAITGFFFFFVFAFNITGTLSTNDFINNDKFSESLVTNQIKCKGLLHNNQLIGVKDPKHQECIDENYLPYNSQFGLQGKLGVLLYSILHQIFHVESKFTIVVYQLLTALISSLLFALLAVWIRIRFSLTTAIVFSILVSLSPMLVSFSRNLYWSLPLMIAPFIYVLYFYKTSFSKRGLVLFMGGLLLLLYLRYLCGYEYLTTITVMVLSAALYILLTNNTKYKIIFKKLLSLGLLSALALILAFSTHIASLTTQTGSINKSIEIIKERANERTFNASNYTSYAYLSLNYVANDFYKTTNEYINYDSLKNSGSILLAVVVAYIAHFLLPVVHLPILQGVFGVYVQSFVVFLILLVILYKYRFKWVNKTRQKDIKNLYIAMTLGMFGYFTWLVFAYSHTIVHAFINGILMYLPTALFGFIILGLFIDFVIKHIKKIKS